MHAVEPGGLKFINYLWRPLDETYNREYILLDRLWTYWYLIEQNTYRSKLLKVNSCWAAHFQHQLTCLQFNCNPSTPLFSITSWRKNIFHVLKYTRCRMIKKIGVRKIYGDKWTALSNCTKASTYLPRKSMKKENIDYC